MSKPSEFRLGHDEPWNADDAYRDGYEDGRAESADEIARLRAALLRIQQSPPRERS